MKLQACTLAAAVFLTSGHAVAASRDIKYGPPPTWIAPAPKATGTIPPEGAPMRIIYSDAQTRVGDDGEETYTAYRVKILGPAALAMGNISASWNPGSDDITIHRLTIIRGGQMIDVLSANKFQIIQRENNLDYAMLDGQLTATLQAPGLQVGDELEFAATLHRRDPTLGAVAHGLMALPGAGSPGAYRLRLVWPDKKAVRWQASPDVAQLVPASSAGQHELIFELRDPASVITADNAPARYNLRRLIEYSGFANWSEISSLVWPLFDKAATLAPDSPVRAEAKKIASATSDPTARVEAALRLVEDRIRYVYIGLDGGNYRPASADDTWNRRFGDCKAKTVLLMALLRELGIANEPVLVNSKGGDGTDQRLPNPGLFDHVLVRATVGAKTYWLDGTRLGDRKLAVLPAPGFRWALPLRASAGDLEPVPVLAPALPLDTEVIEADVSAGFTAPAKFKVHQILRGDLASATHMQLAGLSVQDAERAEKGYWRQQMDWVEPDTAAWRYDDVQNMLILSMTGQGKPDWSGDDQNGRSLDIYHAGFTPPAEFRRPKEQDQSAPWAMEFPSYSCRVTTIRLPPATAKWQWDYAAKPANARLGGKEYWRLADLKDGVMRTVMGVRTYLPEITSDQAKEVNDRLPGFDNKISRVFQVRASAASAHPDAPVQAKDLEKLIDWSSPDAPCAAPSGTVGAGSIEDPQAAYNNGDYIRAMQLWRPLAEHGDANAQLQMGYMYDTGQGVEQNHATAAGWYRQAADQGNAWAQSNLAALYEAGLGMPVDKAGALVWYRKAAEQGNPTAQASVGRMYQYGIGAPKDYAAAADWYRKAADQNDPTAQTGLGALYAFGIGVPMDGAAAARWFQKAADQGFSSAEFMLGLIYENGRGLPRDYASAGAWYRKAADQGHAFAQYRLAVLYDGGRGVAQDRGAALDWYRKAATQGVPEAELSLAEMYEDGAGVPKDHALSAAWYRKAAEHGSNAAQLNMGFSYESGEGVKRDLVQAYLWFSLAEIRPDHSVSANRDRVAAKMTSAQIAKAKELVRDWKPKPPAGQQP